MTSPYPMPPAYPYAPLPPHPRAKTALVLGIISVAGFIVVLPVLLSPLALYYGAVARRDIDREPTRWSGRGEAQAGTVLGIIGTGLLVVALLVVALVVGMLLIVQRYDAGYGT
jgi:hypothetical protein